MIAKELYPRTFLYLAYNKDIRAEAQESFGDNVFCMTYHALARRAMQIDKTKYKDKLKNGLKKSELLKILKLNEQSYANQYKILTVIQKTISNFKNSRDDSIHEEHLDTDGIMEVTSIPLEQQKLAYFILKKVKKMWDMETDESSDFPMDHDTYLKMWHLSDPKIEVDFILFDEAQDANPVVLDIVNMQNCRKIFVGDKHQKIYSWRGAVNAMEEIQAHELSLTKSFRFGENIANLANQILFKKGETRKIIGFEKLSSSLGKVDENKKYTFICRTNAGIILQAILQAKQKRKIHILGGVGDIFDRALSAYLLFSERKNEIPLREFAQFNSWNDFVSISRFAPENSVLVKLVQKFGHELPELIEIFKHALVADAQAEVFFCTAHKSKGLQWDQVKIGSDFSFKSEEEQNLLYVACTRAKVRLDLLDCSIDIIN